MMLPLNLVVLSRKPGRGRVSPKVFLALKSILINYEVGLVLLEEENIFVAFTTLMIIIIIINIMYIQKILGKVLLLFVFFFAITITIINLLFIIIIHC